MGDDGRLCLRRVRVGVSGFPTLAHGRMAATATRKAREVVAAIGTGILPTSPAPSGGSATVPGPVERKKSVKSMYLADKCPTTVREAAEIGTRPRG